MEKKVIPFGSAMGMKVAFSTAVSVDVRSVDKIIWVSGQVSFDEKGNILGKDDMYVQTEHVILNIQSALAEFGAGLDDVVEVNVFVRDMSRLKAVSYTHLGRSLSHLSWRSSPGEVRKLSLIHISPETYYRARVGSFVSISLEYLVSLV